MKLTDLMRTDRRSSDCQELAVTMCKAMATKIDEQERQIDSLLENIRKKIALIEAIGKNSTLRHSNAHDEYFIMIDSIWEKDNPYFEEIKQALQPKEKDATE